MSIMNFKSDLRMDFETHKKHPETPIFHRLKFDETSIYLTKSTFHDLLSSKNEHGHYRIFSWDDWRAKPLLGFELGDKSPALGSVNLVGHYSPIPDDLTEVQYQTNMGKAYFDSALGELDGAKKTGTLRKVKKIDSRNFMRMGEIIPTGAQGKAIYGDGNYIIDGAAGTGKSTTVLQKIKLLQKQKNISSSKILVLVKNKGVITEFQSLLDAIGINDLQLYTTQNFISNNFHFKSKDIKTQLDKIFNSALYIQRHLELVRKEIESISSGRVKGFGDNDAAIKQTFSQNTDILVLVDNYINLRNSFFKLHSENAKEYNVNKKGISVEIDKQKTALTNEIKKNKKNSRKSFSLDGLKTMIKSERQKDSLTLGEEADIRDKVFLLKKKRESELDKSLKINKEKELKILEGLKKIYKDVRLIILTEVFSENFTQSDSDKYLLQLHLKKIEGVTPKFHTIIIDEAQDAMQSHIHLSWLLSDNVILTGDELQKESPVGIGAWKNLGILTNSFSNNEGINIFTLSHNFRQTYELGNCSFSFRQLALSKPLLDISDEYFENQKGFHKPQFTIINNPLDFVSLVKIKITLIGKTFTDSIPVVIFYENNASLKRLSSILKTESISYSHDGDESNSVMFVAIEHISGRSFPVVMAPLINSTNDGAIYIMLSRAKYDLCLFTGGEKDINPHIANLVSKRIIVKYNLKSAKSGKG